MSRLLHVLGLLIAIGLAASCTSTTTTTPTTGGDSGVEEASSSQEESGAQEDAVKSSPAPTSTATEPVVDPTAEPTAGPTTTPTSEPSSPSTSADGDGGVVVTLLDPGMEPRAELRLELPPACAEIMTMTQNQDLTQIIDGVPAPSQGVVGNVTTVRLESERVPDGYRVTSTIVDVTASEATAPSLRTLLEGQLADLIGMRTTEIVTDRGLLVPGSFELEGTEGLGPLADAVADVGESARTAFPEEPVGVGAQWSVTSTTEVSGMMLTASTTYTITDIDGSIVSLAAEQTQQVPDDAQMEAAPGIVVDVVEWDSSTSGTSVLDLESLAPVSQQARGIVSQVLDAGTGVGIIDQTMDIEVTMSGELDDGCAPRPGRSRP